LRLRKFTKALGVPNAFSSEANDVAVPLFAQIPAAKQSVLNSKRETVHHHQASLLVGITNVQALVDPRRPSRGREPAVKGRLEAQLPLFSVRRAAIIQSLVLFFS
jgi:hypothetical protein